MNVLDGLGSSLYPIYQFVTALYLYFTLLFYALLPTCILYPRTQADTESVFFLSSLCLHLMTFSLLLPSSVHELGEPTEVLYLKLERSHSNALPQVKHNPWTQWYHVRKMKRNPTYLQGSKYSILSLTENHTCFYRVFWLSVRTPGSFSR